MSKNKLERYEAITQLDNVIELGSYKPDYCSKLRGKWGEEVFGNPYPVTLELACGKGDYSLALATRYPQRNFIGVDIKGDRIWKGAQHAKDAGIENIRFLRIYIDHIENYFAAAEVSEIWITFPDPYLGEKKKQKRLTAHGFLRRYRNILKPGGTVHLKTDSPELFDFTMETLAEEGITPDMVIRDVHGNPGSAPDLDIITYYEQMHLADGRTIRYVRFRL